MLRIRMKMSTQIFNKIYLAVGYSNGEIFILDVQQSPPQIVGKCVSNVKSLVIDVQFPFDSVSQILAIYENGEAKVYFNGQNLAQEKLKNKNQVQPASYLEYYGVNWKFLTRSVKRYRDEQQELQISNAVFHPTVTFTGFQPFVMVGSKNGNILKFNSNKDIYKGQNFRYPIHRVVNNHIISPQDVEYPNEFQNFFKVDDNQEQVARKFEKLGRPQPEEHIYREFFIEHKKQIVFLSFLEDPSRFVSVDEKGYIYVWEYTKFFYSGSIGGYRPSTKNKVFLGINCFESKSNPMQLFPLANQKDFERESKKYFDQIFTDKDFQRKKINEKKQDARGAVVVTKDVLDPENTKQGDEAVIWKAMVDYSKRQVLELYEDKTQINIKKGYIKSGASLPENKQIILQMIMPHKIEENQEYIYFVRFDTQTCKLKKTKAILETPKLDRQDVIPFKVIENLQPFSMPYLFVCMKQGLFIISLSTGSIVSKIVTHINTIYNDLKFSNTYCSSFVNFFDESFFMGADYADGIWKFQVSDDNNKKNKLVISNLANDYFRLYLL
ncbi:WD40-repeat-containing domain [Pseudocohnilembus persalinus]|uniref:WD40-repeat-containing domain n=1 Tax=Pseudocohnilembus persalinus TaxID=266149 RepID=A0A0V0Q9T5_PSEPJ|nr:WD40-repeat-containing domain [Pseudocohnilembus persalinus]|eukprot:KRW98998.1 WD40-repeat-containing domain [Pseudocohnilembus persalinus]